MSLHSYQRLLRAKYNHLLREKMPRRISEVLNTVLALPHPQREEAFVAWARKSNQAMPHLVAESGAKVSIGEYV